MGNARAALCDPPAMPRWPLPSIELRRLDQCIDRRGVVGAVDDEHAIAGDASDLAADERAELVRLLVAGRHDALEPELAQPGDHRLDRRDPGDRGLGAA